MVILCQLSLNLTLLRFISDRVDRVFPLPKLWERGKTKARKPLPEAAGMAEVKEAGAWHAACGRSRSSTGRSEPSTGCGEAASCFHSCHCPWLGDLPAVMCVAALWEAAEYNEVKPGIPPAQPGMPGEAGIWQQVTPRSHRGGEAPATCTMWAPGSHRGGEAPGTCQLSPSTHS